MKLHELTSAGGKTRKRVGRGESSGMGKTSGRGSTGAKSRAGYSASPVTSGIPWYRKLPIRGFSNFAFRRNYTAVSLSRILDLKTEEINLEVLIEAGIVRKNTKEIKIIGNNELTSSLKIRAHGFSAAAKAAVEAAGGQVIVVGGLI